MKRSFRSFTVGLLPAWLLILTIIVAGAAAPDPASFLPHPDGWKIVDGPTAYTPDNLYQYIDGAAELYLSYDFRHLVVAGYENAAKDSVTVEIYAMASPDDAYGIYSQEKPREGHYLPLGTEGYGDYLQTNFVQGGYYVKMSHFGNKDKGLAILTAFGRSISASLPAKAGLPDILAAFPTAARVPHSCGYAAANFLGHEFLHSAFSAEYTQGSSSAKAFIIRTGTPEEATRMVRQFVATDPAHRNKPLQPGKITFKDRYIGPVTLEWQGRLIWGVQSDDPTLGATLIDQMKTGLIRLKLLKQ